MLALLTGCYGDLSNQIFIEDAKFLAALPSTEAFAFQLPEGSGGADELADGYAVTVVIMDLVGDFLNTVVGGTAVVTQVPPSERGDDFRVWGPGAWDAYLGSYLRMEMSRASDGGIYTFAYQASDTSSGPWEEFTSGTWESEPGAGWQGQLAYDYDRLASATGSDEEGLLLARWDERDVRMVEVEVDAVLSGNEVRFRSRLRAEDDGSGRFDYIESEQIGGRNDEPLVFVSRWDATGRGRTDGVDDGEGFSECWALDGSMTWRATYGETETETGDLDLCPYDDVAQPGEL